MKFELPQLHYDYDALEPYIDEATMHIHHDKHHKAYVDKLNAAIEKHPELESKTLEELLLGLDAIPEDIRTAVRNNGGGHLNHSFFWTVMKKGGGGEPAGAVADSITASFGNFTAFKEQFSTAAATFFGSGWTWLAIDKSGKGIIISTKDHVNPIMEDLTPILTLDVWEHAYYLKYQNRRPEYIENWWHVVNWGAVARYFEGAKK